MLEWNVYVEDFNGKEIVPYNVFNHGRFLDDCKRNARKNGKDYTKFCEQLRRDLMYYFWSKCEWEIILAPWIRRDTVKELKIDVFDQVMLNWDEFKAYVWNHGAELRRREKRCMTN